MTWRGGAATSSVEQQRSRHADAGDQRTHYPQGSHSIAANHDAAEQACRARAQATSAADSPKVTLLVGANKVAIEANADLLSMREWLHADI